MRVGCCVSDAGRLGAAGRAGAEYAEVPVASWIMAAEPSELALLESARPRPLAANVFLPTGLAAVGPSADQARRRRGDDGPVH